MKKFMKNRTVLGLASIILALILSFGVTPFLNKQMKSQETIIRATKTIKKGEIIGPDKIIKVKVGGYNLPQDIIKEQQELIGKYATVDIFKDDYFLNSKISDQDNSDNYYLKDENMALSITIKSLASGLSGKLKEGDIISIISTSDDGDKPRIIPELRYVKILSVISKEGKDLEGVKEELPSTVTLSVDPVQAEKLVEQEQDGNIHMALVFRGEENYANEYLKIQEEYLLLLEELEELEEEEIDGETEEIENTQDEEKPESSEEIEDEEEKPEE